MAGAVTESVNTQQFFLHSCFVEPASQEVVKFLKSLIHFVSFHPGHIMAMSCICRDIGLSQLKKIGFGHWIHLLSIAVGSGVLCLTVANGLDRFHTWGIRNFGLKPSSKVLG